MKTRRGRRAPALVIAGLCLVATVGCGTAQSGDDVVTVVVTETAGSTTKASTSTAGDRKLSASFAALEKTLSAPVGLALVPVGGGDVVTFGDQTTGVAWSTSKVPLAVAADRANGVTDAETSAIVNSDNAAAETLWASLGTPAQAAAAMTAVLREGGDSTTTVPSARRRSEFSIFGQTEWALRDAATFAAGLPCLRGTTHVLSLMENVAGNQQWGLKAIEKRTSSVKGGWGPTAGSGYLVRQLGVLTLRDGRQVGVAMSTQTTAGSMEPGAAVLSAVGRWMSQHLAALPAGRCAPAR
ncbi:hypothetical protein [Gordonia hydrophobica]|uniref:Beta-lactamase class A n=1 Tax=Gordonia hydrophobica TaxID=40516 RepID=A0ABZ2U2J7_9ACTN|nr:hypothetical protein [Gordonia hydrophobica]MBM7369018.1 hypothetical protein [Gordonia hydrophobica]